MAARRTFLDVIDMDVLLDGPCLLHSAWSRAAPKWFMSKTEIAGKASRRRLVSGHDKAWDPVGADKAVMLTVMAIGWILATTVVAGAGRALRR